VFNLLRLAMTGANVELPDPTSIFPYLGLFTIVILSPDDVVGCCISTQHLPTLSILQNSHFIPAPSTVSPADQDMARIFDVVAVSSTDPPISLGTIPLSPEDPEFQHQRYWRVPVKTEAVLAALIERVGIYEFECQEIHLAQMIPCILRLQRHGMLPASLGFGNSNGPGSGGGGGPSGGRGPSGGYGRSGSEIGMPKRDLQSGDHNEPPAKRSRTEEDPREGLGETDVLKSRSVEKDEPELSDRSGEQSRRL
jgi:hypothetical protein